MKNLQHTLTTGVALFLAVTTLAQGNVGIGTSSPQRKLHIHNGSSVFSGLMLSTDATGETTGDGIHFGIQYQADAVGNRYGYLIVKEDVPMLIGTNDRTNDIRIANNGNVGFGISDPAFRVELDGSMRMRGVGALQKRIVFRNDAGTEDMGSIGHLNDNIISMANNKGGVQFSKFYFDIENEKMGVGAIPGSSDGKILVHYNSTTTNPHLTLRESTTGDYSRLEFANSGTSRVWHLAGQATVGTGTTGRENDILNVWNSGYGDIMTFRGNGRVGILTTNPATGYALSVNGKIICEELRVQNSTAWPDYVFENNYKMLSLSELAQFIATNKHLPGIPNAATVAKEGIAVGEMQKRMMEKIEELSLYILQQQDQIDNQNKKIAALEKRMQ